MAQVITLGTGGTLGITGGGSNIKLRPDLH